MRWEYGCPEPPHGKYPCFLVGIQQFFDPNLPFLLPADVRLEQTLNMHFRDALKRLLHSLDMLQRWTAKYAEHYERYHEEPTWAGTIDLSAGMAAESVFMYLNMLIDDIARIVPIIFDDRTTSVQVFSGRSNEGLRQQSDKFPEIESLINLASPNSWWHLAFTYRDGVRQQMVHYPALIQFTGVQKQGNDHIEIEAQVVNSELNRRIDYFGTLRLILSGFCDWLDQMEQAFITKLQARSMVEHFTWVPKASCEKVWLPVDYPFDAPREIPEQDFLYLPVCENSDTIGCTVQYKFNSHKD